MQYVSLLSPAFSGSTLLSILLTSQPRAIGFGDTYFNPSNSLEDSCTCGRTFLECEPRAGIVAAVRAGGYADYSWESAAAVPIPRSWPRSREGYWPLAASSSLPLLRSLPRSARRLLFRNFYRQNRLMLDYLESDAGYDFYFDGCKSLTRLELLRTEIPDIRVIHLVRHPGAILYHDHKYGISNVPDRLKRWAQYHSRAHRFRELVGPDRYLAVPYEKIVQDPAYFLNRVSTFLDMECAPDDDPAVIDRSRAHILGNAMRENVQRIIDYSNTWRQHISADSQAGADALFRSTPWVVDLYADWDVTLRADGQPGPADGYRQPGSVTDTA